MLRGVLAVVLSCSLISGTALAQPGVEPPPPPAPVAADVVIADRATYDAAFEDLLRGDLARAALGFRNVAEGGPPELRASAAELARFADELIRRRGSIRVDGGAPGSPPGPVDSIHEDDTPTGGRTSFVVTTTIASLYTGIVALDLMDVDDARAGAAVVMGSTAIGVLGSVYGTRGRTITGGMADAWRLGLYVGAGNALLLSGPLGIYDSSSNTSEKVQTFVLGASWGLATTGLLIADHYRPTRAQVTVAETFGLMGVGSTLLTLAIIQPDDLGGKAFLGLTAAGLDGGLLAGAMFADTIDWSHSRARLVQLSSFLGALAGGGTSILLLADSGGDNTARLAAGITLGGLWAGFLVGRHLTRDMAPDYRFRQSSASSAMVAPTMLRGERSNALGLGVSGSF